MEVITRELSNPLSIRLPQNPTTAVLSSSSQYGTPVIICETEGNIHAVLKQGDPLKMKDELAIHATLQGSEFFAELVHASVGRDKSLLATRFYPWGDLEGYTSYHAAHHGSTPVPSDLWKALYVRTVSGMLHAHSKRVILFDIKNKNVVLDPVYGCIFIDLGVSQIVASVEYSFVYNVKGSKNHFYPLFLMSENAEVKAYIVDYYSLGITLGKLVYPTRFRDFVTMSQECVRAEESHRKIFDKTKGLDDDQVNAITALLNGDKAETKRMLAEFTKTLDLQTALEPIRDYIKATKGEDIPHFAYEHKAEPWEVFLMSFQQRTELTVPEFLRRVELKDKTLANLADPKDPRDQQRLESLYRHLSGEDVTYDKGPSARSDQTIINVPRTPNENHITSNPTRTSHPAIAVESSRNVKDLTKQIEEHQRVLVCLQADLERMQLEGKKSAAQAGHDHETDSEDHSSPPTKLSRESAAARPRVRGKPKPAITEHSSGEDSDTEVLAVPAVPAASAKKPQMRKLRASAAESVKSTESPQIKKLKERVPHKTPKRLAAEKEVAKYSAPTEAQIDKLKRACESVMQEGLRGAGRRGNVLAHFDEWKKCDWLLCPRVLVKVSASQLSKLVPDEADRSKGLGVILQDGPDGFQYENYFCVVQRKSEETASKHFCDNSHRTLARYDE